MERTSVRLVLAGSMLALLPGCLAVAAGAAAGYGTAQYVRNDVSRTYGAPLATVWPHALASLDEAGFPASLDAPTQGATARLEVNDADLEAVQLPDGSTRVTVTIGTFSTAAHRTVSDRIHEGIARRLAPAP